MIQKNHLDDETLAKVGPQTTDLLVTEREWNEPKGTGCMKQEAFLGNNDFLKLPKVHIKVHI